MMLPGTRMWWPNIKKEDMRNGESILCQFRQHRWPLPAFFSAAFNKKSSVIMKLRIKPVILLRGDWLLPDSGKLSTVGAPPGTWKGSTKLTRKKIVILKKHWNLEQQTYTDQANSQVNQDHRRPLSGICFYCSAPGHYACEWPGRIAGGGRFYGGSFS